MADWVPTSERMPPRWHPVIVCSSTGVVQQVTWSWTGEDWDCALSEVDRVGADEITHWQMLPQPPPENR